MIDDMQSVDFPSPTKLAYTGFMRFGSWVQVCVASESETRLRRCRPWVNGSELILNTKTHKNKIVIKKGQNKTKQTNYVYQSIPLLSRDPPHPPLLDLVHAADCAPTLRRHPPGPARLLWKLYYFNYKLDARR